MICYPPVNGFCGPSFPYSGTIDDRDTVSKMTTKQSLIGLLSERTSVASERALVCLDNPAVVVRWDCRNPEIRSHLMTGTEPPVSNHETTERLVLCFDRDSTVSVNPHPDERAVPIGYIQWWAHVEEIPVFATGNQHLRVEAEIPGISEAERAWEEYVTGEEYQYSNSQFEDYIKPRRRDGLRLIQDLYEETFPDQKFRFIVVDDSDVSDLEDEGPWTHYFPWDFVEAVESGEFALEEPPSDAYRNDGVPFNSTDQPDFEYDQKRELRQIQKRVRTPVSSEI